MGIAFCKLHRKLRQFLEEQQAGDDDDAARAGRHDAADARAPASARWAGGDALRSLYARACVDTWDWLDAHTTCEPGDEEQAKADAAGTVLFRGYWARQGGPELHYLSTEHNIDMFALSRSLLEASSAWWWEPVEQNRADELVALAHGSEDRIVQGAGRSGYFVSSMFERDHGASSLFLSATSRALRRARVLSHLLTRRRVHDRRRAVWARRGQHDEHVRRDASRRAAVDDARRPRAAARPRRARGRDFARGARALSLCASGSRKLSARPRALSLRSASRSTRTSCATRPRPRRAASTPRGPTP